MAIDDPQDALKVLQESEERSRSPLVRFIPDLARIFGLLPASFLPSAGEPRLTGVAAFAKVAAWIIDHKEAGARKALLDMLADELRYVKQRLAAMADDGGAHVAFMQTEFPGLLLDGLQKAEQIRAADRITRLGKILGHAADQGPVRKPDYTEEMMRIAMIVDEDDLAMLQVICDRQRGSLGSHGRVGRTQVLQSSPVHAIRARGFTDGQIVSGCAKLESLGLIWEAEDRSQNNLVPDPGPYALLQKGLDFIIYVNGTART